MDNSAFANLSRDELIEKARALGVDRPELMTRVELADELVRRSESDPLEQRRVRGWLGVARDLVASVVESGLNLPDAAALIRGERTDLELKGPEPVATVTLAEIYATQGHTQRALDMLDEVLLSEPEHEAAQLLRERLLRERAPRAARAERTEEIRPAPEAVAEPAPETIAGAAPEAVSEPAPETIAGAAPEAVSEPAPETIAEATPEAVFEPAPETIAEATPEAVFEPAEETEPEPRTERQPAVLEPQTEAALSSDPEEAQGAPPASESIGGDARSDGPASAPVAAELGPTVIVLRAFDADPIVCWDLGGVVEDPDLTIVCVALSSDGTTVERNELSVSVGEPRGRAVLESVAPSARLRAALGVTSDGGFQPLAIASELTLQRGGVLAISYRPPGIESPEPSEAERALVSSFAA